MNGNTITGRLGDLLRKLRAGTLTSTDVVILDQVRADELMADIRSVHSVTFQERSIGRKHEIGVARAVRFEVAARKAPNSRFAAAHMIPVLRHCLFISSYDNSISEITTTVSVQVTPEWGKNNVIVRMGRGYKLDRSPDGWVVKTLMRRLITLSEDLLANRGWRFDVLVPFAVKP